MERRYLVAALAIIATFAVTTRGFHALENMSWLRVTRVHAMTKTQCPSSTGARALAKIRTHLRPRYPEEAQFLAEMNIPIAESTIAEQMSRQDQAIAQCARARALQEAEHARRDAMRLQRQMTQAASQMSLPPMAISATLPPDMEARIQAQTAALSARMAANAIKLQIAGDKLRQSAMRFQDVEVPVVEVTDDGGRVSTHTHVRTHTRCNTNHPPATPDPPTPEMQ